MLKQLKFSHKILLATALVMAVVLAAFASFNAYLQRQAIDQTLQQTLTETGRITATNVSYWLETRIKVADALVQTILTDTPSGNFDKLPEQKIYTEVFSTLYLAQPDGTFIARNGSPVPAGYDPRKRPWYTEAVAAGGLTLSSPYIFASNGKLGLTISAPLLRNGQLGGVVACYLYLSTLTEMISALDAGGLGEAFLVDANGKVLVSSHPEQVLKSLKDVFPDNTPTLAPGFQTVRVGGSDRLVSFTPVEGLPVAAKWYLGLSIDEAKAYAPVTQARNLAIVATVVAVIVMVLLLGLLIRGLLRPLRDLGRAMEDIAQGEGDLTRRLPVETRDEFGLLAQAFNQFVARIHTSIRDVAQSTGQLNQGTRRVLEASQSSMQQSDVQSQRTTSVAAAINEMGAATQEIARNAAHASGEARSARQQGEEGRRVLDEAMTAMQALSAKIGTSCEHIEALNGKTANIGQILDVIRGISEQTNLLALNAAIEAARAGEAGRGFAVVADEVRSLASRTQSSAQQIQQMIEELQNGSRDAVALMQESQRQSTHSMQVAQQAGSSLGSVTERIGEIDGQNQSVATATEEQTSVVETLNQDISEINLLNQQGVDNLQATLAACTALEAEADRLQKLVGGFRI
ncbi:methyl-accepting chemotaxis protein [Pseudomonas oryzihabitans]|uniref:methyl-accepting chemotaxis protein n=1 Tax=Pseudomonas oryzihabitans TaxID=47885 RepID=UPI0011244FC5|nr:methyl-accepting chemotaxis protein [Pseudomonas psychrotolerans]MDR6678188.1 methyl-accepting chemotaxis protein [Pseudomonas psychrotolerans]QDD89849.1 chemotaxis protein [Pseudomonas psychrotolerans]